MECRFLGSDEKTRGAVVYRIAGSNPARYRIRVEKWPDTGPGWFGGKVLWGHDQDNREHALEIASAWVKEGKLPAEAVEDCTFCGWGAWTGKSHDEFVSQNTTCTPHLPEGEVR